MELERIYSLFEETAKDLSDEDKFNVWIHYLYSRWSNGTINITEFRQCLVDDKYMRLK